jgi:formylglycine-generating enzyme required for sulfatase activity
MRIPLLGLFAAVLLLGGCGEATQADMHAVGSEFSDCERCPTMVVVPAGSFTMGSPASERYRGAEDQHEVTIAEPFAVSKFEITFDQWEACVADGGCDAYSPIDHGWGRGDRPVVEMNFMDAQNYVAWLREETDQPYRLLSESEWEYAARAGSEAAYSFGDTIAPDLANYDARTDYDSPPGDDFREQTLPVGSFAPNAFGLYDMHGNAWEWVEDCWNDAYSDATPADGSAWLEGDCDGRILRGGSWEDYPGDVRVAARVASGVRERSWSDGIRVARDL